MLSDYKTCYSKSKQNTFEGNWIGSLFAEHILTGKSRIRGKLVSVFDGAVNIKTTDNRLFVITKNKVRSPITLNVIQDGGNHSFKKFMKFGSIIGGSHDQVMIDNKKSIGVGKSRLFQSNLGNITIRSLSNFRDKFDFIFPSMIKLGRSGCLLSPDITTRGLLPEQIRAINSNGKKTDDDAAFAKFMGSTLGKLCGRGPGYTPAGDDFISGFLIMFNWCANCLDFERINLPQEYSTMTSWTSYKLIEYSQGCVCDEEIQAMVNSVALGRADEYMKKMVPLSSRGHTSGIDLVTGITCALYTLIDRKFRTSMLDKLNSYLRKS